jgi:hypothetical protein
MVIMLGVADGDPYGVEKDGIRGLEGVGAEDEGFWTTGTEAATVRAEKDATRVLKCIMMNPVPDYRNASVVSVYAKAMLSLLGKCGIIED